MATQFVFDTFTEAADTLLSAHTPEVGSSWVAHPSYPSGTATVLAAEDKIRGSLTSASALYLNTAVPPSADYEVRATSRIITAASARCGVVARYSATEDTGYLLLYIDNEWQLRRSANTVSTVLASYNGSEVLNTDYEIRLAVFGDTVYAYIGGILRAEIKDQSPVLSAGYAGVITRVDDRLDNFLAATLDSAEARNYQTLSEVVVSPASASARIYQGLAEAIPSPTNVDARVYQTVTEVITTFVSEARVEHALVEVLSRELELSSAAIIDFVGVADLRQGLPLGGEAELVIEGLALLDIGTTLVATPAQIEVSIEGRVQTRARLASENEIDFIGYADVEYGTEIRPTLNSFSLRMSGSLRVGPEAENLSTFFLVF